MKLKRKVISALSASFLLITLTGFNQPKEESITFTNVTNGGGVTFTWYYVEDKILRQDTTSILSYESIDATDEKQARLIMSTYHENYRGFPGIEHRLDYKEHDVLVHASVDFSKARNSDLCQVQGIPPDCPPPNLSVSEMVKLMISLGFREVKSPT